MPFGPMLAGFVFIVLCLAQHLSEEEERRKADEKKKKERAKEQEQKAEFLLTAVAKYYGD